MSDQQKSPRKLPPNPRTDSDGTPRATARRSGYDEMGATARDLAESVHPHPTLTETIMEAAEVFYGESTHTLPRKRKES